MRPSELRDRITFATTFWPRRSRPPTWPRMISMRATLEAGMRRRTSKSTRSCWKCVRRRPRHCPPRRRSRGCRCRRRPRRTRYVLEHVEGRDGGVAREECGLVGKRAGAVFARLLGLECIRGGHGVIDGMGRPKAKSPCAVMSARAGRIRCRHCCSVCGACAEDPARGADSRRFPHRAGPARPAR